MAPSTTTKRRAAAAAAANDEAAADAAAAPTKRRRSRSRSRRHAEDEPSLHQKRRQRSNDDEDGNVDSRSSSQLESAVGFLYAPHTVSALLAGLALLGHRARVLDPPPPRAASDAWSRAGAAAGVWAALLVFLLYSVVQGPRAPLRRPHPAVWRLAHGLVVAYALLLVFLLFQSVDDARAFLRHLSPALGREVEYRTYASDCRLWLPNGSPGGSGSGSGIGRPNWAVLRATVLDEFVLAHTLGWWAKALVLRHTPLLWLASVGFELCELSFRHLLPNFNECWWDSAVLDVALCNWLGIAAGLATLRWARARHETYDWQGLGNGSGSGGGGSGGKGSGGLALRARLERLAFASPKRLLQALAPVAVMLAFDLNVFFLKFALWVPPRDRLNTARLVLWFLLALPAAAEYYEFIGGGGGCSGGASDSGGDSGGAGAGGTNYDGDSSDGGGGKRQQNRQRGGGGRSGGGSAAAAPSKLGTFAWLALAVTALETMASVKFGAGLYPTPAPRAVVAAWAAAGALLAGGLAAWQLRRWRRDSGSGAAKAA